MCLSSRFREIIYNSRISFKTDPSQTIVHQTAYFLCYYQMQSTFFFLILVVFGAFIFRCQAQPFLKIASRINLSSLNVLVVSAEEKYSLSTLVKVKIFLDFQDSTDL